MHFAQIKMSLLTMGYPETPYAERFEPIWLVRLLLRDVIAKVFVCSSFLNVFLILVCNAAS